MIFSARRVPPKAQVCSEQETFERIRNIAVRLIEENPVQAIPTTSLTQKI